MITFHKKKGITFQLKRERNQMNQNFWFFNQKKKTFGFLKVDSIALWRDWECDEKKK